MSEEEEWDPQELEERQKAEDRMLREEWNEVRPVLPAAIIPAGLVTLFVSILLGQWVWRLLPFVFFGGIIAAHVYFNYRGKMDSELPFVIPGHGRFTGERKRQLLRGGAIVLFLAIAGTLLAEVLAGRLFGWLRDWTVPWPW